MPPGDFNLSAIPQAYEKTVGAHPLIETGVLGSLGAGAGYFGADYLTNWLLRRLPKPLLRGVLSDMTQQDIEDARNTIRNITTALGGTLGAGYGVLKHMDLGSGARGALGSMFDSEYWENNPEARRKAIINAIKDRYKSGGKSPVKPRWGTFRSGRTQKRASAQTELEFTAAAFKDPMDKETVPISASLDLLNADPFLTINQKQFSKNLVEGAEDSESGLTSGKKLMRSAVRAGTGYGSSYLFGRTAGAIFSLPPKLTRRLSQIGGVAGALINTGIFD